MNRFSKHTKSPSAERVKKRLSEILEYNSDKADIEHMIEKEGINFFLHLQMLNKQCIKRADPEWSQFGISELLRMEKLILDQSEANGLSSVNAVVNRYTFAWNRNGTLVK